jgi:hypothetical protein
MITDVKKIKEGTFMINESVVVSNLDFSDDEGVTYSLDYDENLIQEKEAFKLVDLFFSEVFENYLEK